MKITIAKTAGFCMGVRRAVDIVLDASNGSNEKICTFGPLIHNPQVLDLLEQKGIPAISVIPEEGSGTVIIRAHGVPPEVNQKLEDAGFRVIDATCPRVIKVQRIIRKHAKEGCATIIIGDDDHPEVIGLLGYSGENGHVVNSFDELNALPEFEKAIIVAQTTQNTEFYEDVKKWSEKTHPNYKVFDTICDSTEKRQAEITSLAETADAVVVVGGKNSGNTQRLAEIADLAGKPSFHIEDPSELDMSLLGKSRKIAVTAGASTPNWIIKKVFRHIETGLIKKRGIGLKPLFLFMQKLLLTNIFLALGAGALCYTATKLQGIEHNTHHSLIAVLYILSMHIFNNLTAINADKYNDPERATFYENNKIPLAVLAVISGATGLGAVYMMGKTPFVILLVMSILGLSYKTKILPRRKSDNSYQSIQDIPGSKTVLIAVAWGIVTSILPALSVNNTIGIATIIAFILSTVMVFTRTAFFDILDMQGDRIVGKETLPILLGDKGTVRILKNLLITLVVLLPLSAALHIAESLGYFLMLYPLSMLAVLIAHKKGRIASGFKLALSIESHFILAGLITYLWALFS